MTKLPSVLDIFTEEQIQQTRFVQPKAQPIHEEVPGDLSFRRFILERGDATPVHFHKNRHKVYFGFRQGYVEIYIFSESGIPTKHILRSGESFHVPAGQAHCLRYFGIENWGKFTISVVSTPNEPLDIYWEEAAEELVSRTPIR